MIAFKEITECLIELSWNFKIEVNQPMICKKGKLLNYKSEESKLSNFQMRVNKDKSFIMTDQNNLYFEQGFLNFFYNFYF